MAKLAVKGGIAAAEGAAYGALGETRTGENRLTHAGYGALGGVLGRGASGVVHGAARRLVREADPILRAATDIAQREGIPLHISQIAQSTPLRTAASVAKYIPFSGADVAARNQQNAWNKALTRHVGDATERLDDRWLASQKQRFNDTYNAIWDDRNIALSPQAAARMQEIVNDAYRDLGIDGGLLGGGGIATGGLIPTLATIAGGATLGRALNSATLGNLLARNAGTPNVLARLLAAEGTISTSRRAARQAAQRAFIAHQQQLHNADQ
ncbi:hypothetical protein XFPR_10430 [Xylella fastidiosa]|uniref:hypothetical protein n=1 Tax=Xylella fastidiosa TaxID=2371 RepID=UPI0003D34A27|nr:hypothetical protein [Xylella fastidiosa]ALR04976.1 hypothetical protein XFPR_10430 [Xylella fastidiosa]KXB19655.1 hypothetical protein ADT30_09075 [Xylella fastidiosa]OJZ69764.1 hypothetical protein B375_0210030 [Xylella fastidiosa 6c]